MIWVGFEFGYITISKMEIHWDSEHCFDGNG